VITPPDCNDEDEFTADFCDAATDSCAHVPARGACCDSWRGTCEEDAPQAACDCDSCVWTTGEACADVDCEFMAIPTTSQWGIVVLTLLLLTGAKVWFGRGGRIHVRQ
jgi:hypothetical protein